MTTLSYLNLITSEFRDKPKYIAMLTGVFGQFVSTANLMAYINSCLDPDIATGAQLDLIGQYIGQSRKLVFDVTGLETALSDEDYRFLLKAKIAQQAWDGTIEGIYKIWNELFDQAMFSIVDNQDMTCQLVINPATLTQIQIELILLNVIVPKPAGVSYTYQFLSRVLFSYDMDTTYFKGYDLGYWNGEEDQSAVNLSLGYI